MIEANYFDSERINCLIDGVQSKTAQKAMRFRQASSISLSGKQSNDGAGETGRPLGARTCGKETCGTVDCFRTKLVKTQFYKLQEKNDEGSLEIHRLDVTFLSAILLDGRVQPEAEEKR